MSGAALNTHYTISGCSDSYYEYLLKGWIQSGKKDQQLRFHYNEAIEGVNQLLLMRNKRSGWQFLGELLKKRAIHSMQTLTCFAPGMMFLDLYHSNSQSAYRKQMNQRNERVARSVLYTCFMMCNSTTSGLPPESCSFSELKGMTISQRLKHYALRPEIIESFFLLKEVTGDPIAQLVLLNIVAICVGSGAGCFTRPLKHIAKHSLDMGCILMCMVMEWSRTLRKAFLQRKR